MLDAYRGRDTRKISTSGCPFTSRPAPSFVFGVAPPGGVLAARLLYVAALPRNSVARDPTLIGPPDTFIGLTGQWSKYNWNSRESVLVGTARFRASIRGIHAATLVPWCSNASHPKEVGQKWRSKI